MPLLKGQRWAKEALRFLIKDKNLRDTNVLLWTTNPIGCSSLFTGLGYPERAFHYIEAARFGEDPELPERMHESWLNKLFAACS